MVVLSTIEKMVNGEKYALLTREFLQTITLNGITNNFKIIKISV